ncbi:HD domain-containing protein [Brucepastera parasyntrophica]|nr:HD domain-containing protein [Brucepastera parasyntrophica]ULQ61112.1 HD domain-containing protein [Brucepastera parasyntrophica]
MYNESRFSIAIRDPVWKHIWLTPELRDITLSPPFLRLYRIKQLGPTEYVYPGAVHTRAAHSIGVYYVALKMLRILLRFGADKWVSRTGCYSFLAAALLHDLGHFPYAHSLKELSLKEHEELTAAIICSEPLKSCISKTGADPEMTAAIINKSDAAPTGQDTETLFFRNILSGVLDPDKLDYLNRDAYYCGVPYGIQDMDFILSRLRPDISRGITIDSKAIMSVESILFSKYLMYRSVYWHKNVRIATAMMKKVIFAMLDQSLSSPEALYNLDDYSIYDVINCGSFSEKEIAGDVMKHRLYGIIAEFPFDENNSSMLGLETMKARSEKEEAIAEYLSRISSAKIEKKHVLIDIPERISFESDLFITDENTGFSSSSTVFSRDTVASFTASLRKIRLAVHPDFVSIVKNIPELLIELAKCFDIQ